MLTFVSSNACLLLAVASSITTLAEAHQHAGHRPVHKVRDATRFQKLVLRGAEAASQSVSSAAYSATTASDVVKPSSSSMSWSSTSTTSSEWSSPPSSTATAYTTPSSAVTTSKAEAAFTPTTTFSPSLSSTFSTSTTSSSSTLSSSSLTSTSSASSFTSTTKSGSSSSSMLSSSSSSSSFSLTSATYSSIAPCATGQCDAGCATGSIKDPSTGNCIDISSDINNCGGLGLVCTTQDSLGQTTCYQGVCQDCGLGAMGYWDSLFNECSALEDNFCYTLTDPTASALNGVFEKCNVLNWFTTFSKQNGLDTMDTSSETFTHAFAAALGVGYTFDCTPAAPCENIDTPVAPYSPPGSTDLYYRQVQFGGYLILEALSNYNNIAWNLITNANTALLHVDNLLDNIVDGFGLSAQPADNSMDPVQLSSVIANALLGIMMLAAPETMPLDMALMIGNSGFMTWYNQQTKDDPMTPIPDLNAASYTATLDPIVSFYTNQQNAAVVDRFQTYDNVYALISMPGIVDSLIHAFPGYDSVNDMVTYLMANLLNDIFRDRQIFFTTQDYGDTPSCQAALSGTAAAANGATCLGSRLYYANYWLQTFPAIDSLSDCPAAAIYDASVGVGLNSDQLQSIATGSTYGFSLDVLFTAALACSTSSINLWGGFPLTDDPQYFPQPTGFSGRLATDTCVVNTPVCDVNDAQLNAYCKASNAPVDCDTLEGISLYCANQLGVTTGLYNFCSTLWPQGYKFCTEAYSQAQSAPSCGVPMGYPAKRNTLKKRTCNMGGNYGYANCAQATCTSDYIDYSDLFTDYSCDASTTTFNPYASSSNSSSSS